MMKIDGLLGWDDGTATNIKNRKAGWFLFVHNRHDWTDGDKMIVFGRIVRRGRVSPAGVRKSQDFRRDRGLAELQLRWGYSPDEMDIMALCGRFVASENAPPVMRFLRHYNYEEDTYHWTGYC
jgi:hypothetical protein